MAMSITGYARVSTADQDPTSQIEALRAAGCDPIYVEHASGATMERSQWSECNRGLGRGDTLVVVRIDRLGRSLADLVSTLDDLGTRGVHFRSLTEGIDTSTALGRMFYQLAGAFAEYERTLISERTRAGLDNARGSSVFPVRQYDAPSPKYDDIHSLRRSTRSMSRSRRRAIEIKQRRVHVLCLGDDSYPLELKQPARRTTPTQLRRLPVG